jgi:Asp-tRNA(Asn)/Glu-tRNA(Gln) amidotransferase A subunit family amidase
MIVNKQVSCHEIVSELRDRIDQINPSINAIVTTDWEKSFETARICDDNVVKGNNLGILHGVPVAVKDLTWTKNMRTTFGSTLYADFVPDEDDNMIAGIRSEGGIIIGKTNTPEFGAGANTFNDVFGITRNPFDRALSVAGSSGGSAAALAANLVPLATGSDMGGSLRTPASFCGVVGFRPTPGTVPAGRNRLAWSPLMVEGPMARNVRDASLLLAAMAQGFDLDPLGRPIPKQSLLELLPADLSSLKVAFSENLGFAPVANSVRESFRSKVSIFEKKFALATWDHPDLGDADFIFEILRAVHFREAYSQYTPEQVQNMSTNIQENLILTQSVNLNDVARAYGEQTKAWRRARAFFKDYDVLITPAAAVPPFTVEQRYPEKVDDIPMRNYIQWFALGFGISIIGHPCVCLPCGRGAFGMPLGIQVVGRYADDLRTLAIACALEDLFAEFDELRRPEPLTHT